MIHVHLNSYKYSILLVLIMNATIQAIHIKSLLQNSNDFTKDISLESTPKGLHNAQLKTGYLYIQSPGIYNITELRGNPLWLEKDKANKDIYGCYYGSARDKLISTVHSSWISYKTINEVTYIKADTWKEKEQCFVVEPVDPWPKSSKVRARILPGGLVINGLPWEYSECQAYIVPVKRIE